MNVRRVRAAALVVTLGLGALVFQSCPFAGALEDCYGENTISRSEYEDLNAFEQLLYEENWCGRYTRRSTFLDDVLD
jgi:hypothetical protein